MNKSKTLLATLLACSLLLVGCNSSDKENSQEGSQPGTQTSVNPTSTNPTSSSTPVDPLADALSEFMNYLNASNISLRVQSEAIVTVNETVHRSISQQFIRFDGNKVYASLTIYNFNPDTVISSECYYEFGETNYQYYKDATTWKKAPFNYSMNYVRPSSTINGLEDFITKFKANAVACDDGYTSPTFNQTIRTRDLVERSGRNPDDFEILVESVSVPCMNSKLTIENGKVTSLYMESNPVGLNIQPGSGEKQTVRPVVEENAIGKIKVYDFHDIGTTVVTLPNIE